MQALSETQLSVADLCVMTHGRFMSLLSVSGDGASVNAQNADGVTPLHDAVQRNDPNIIPILVKHGANPNVIAHQG